MFTPSDFLGFSSNDAGNFVN